MNLKEILVATLMPAIQAVGEAELTELLGKLKASNPEVYPGFIKSMYGNFKLLEQLAAKTSSKIDDGLVEMVLDVLTQLSTTDNIQLTD